jgi:hypothetical protein
MDSKDFEKMVLKRKKDKAIEIVVRACEVKKIPLPKINFEGCPQEKEDHLAHYHPDQHKICISEFQLHKLNMDDIEKTMIHELTHFFEYSHNSRFGRINAEIRSKVWKPPQGVTYIGGDTVNEESRRIRENPERMAWVNEDSDLLKALEGRTSHDTEIVHNEAELSKHTYEALRKRQEAHNKLRKIQKVNIKRRKQKAGQELNRNKKEKKIKTRKYQNKTPNKKSGANLKEGRYRPMTDVEKKESREKLGINIEDRSHIKIAKKKGLLSRLKEYLRME